MWNQSNIGSFQKLNSVAEFKIKRFRHWIQWLNSKSKDLGFEFSGWIQNQGSRIWIQWLNSKSKYLGFEFSGWIWIQNQGFRIWIQWLNSKSKDLGFEFSCWIQTWKFFCNLIAELKFGNITSYGVYRLFCVLRVSVCVLRACVNAFCAADCCSNKPSWLWLKWISLWMWITTCPTWFSHLQMADSKGVLVAIECCWGFVAAALCFSCTSEVLAQSRYLLEKCQKVILDLQGPQLVASRCLARMVSCM